MHDFLLPDVSLALVFFCLHCSRAWLALVLSFTLFRAQIGYMFSVRTFWRWSSSSFRSCLLELTAFALWCRVFITLYFAAMEWWLSHCRYKSVCVGFLYTLVFKLPSSLMVTKVSKKGMEPSPLLASFVNWILSSMLFMCWKKLSSWVFWMITNVSSTNLL